LRRFACVLLRRDRDGADDLVQDGLERALSHWNLRRNEGNLRGWLHTILYNRFLSDQHRVRRRGPHDPLSQETELPGIDGGQHSVLEHRDVLRALAALPEEQRRCFCWSASRTSPTRRRLVCWECPSAT
jgi:RNA polymerase sigma-70 factor (ECF subfamily)